MTATASMQAFDPAVHASTGDYWADLVLGSSTYSPLVLAPGASGTITLTFTPDAMAVGQKVRGSIYVDTVNTSDPTATGDEVVALPYAYTVVP
jgi:ABC-type molybdate transport system permease subunit